MKSFVKSLKAASMVFLCCVSGQGVLAKEGPLVVEYYGPNSCAVDQDIQEQLVKVLHEYQDAILVNCRMYIGRENEDPKYTNDYCQGRAVTYGHRFRVPGKLPLVVVNGRWDAVNKKVLQAVKMGFVTDKIMPLSVKRHDNMLHVSMPSVEGVKKGSLVLYTYRQSEGLHYDVELQSGVLEQDGMSLAQSSSPALSAEKSDLLIRSIVSIDTIADFNGTEQDVVYDLSNVRMGSHITYDDIGYAVVLYNQRDQGEVLAAGQIFPPEEQLRFLPHSEPGYHDPDTALDIFKSLGQ